MAMAYSSGVSWNSASHIFREFAATTLWLHIVFSRPVRLTLLPASPGRAHLRIPSFPLIFQLIYSICCFSTSRASRSLTHRCSCAHTSDCARGSDRRGQDGPADAASPARRRLPACSASSSAPFFAARSAPPSEHVRIPSSPTLLDRRVSLRPQYLVMRPPPGGRRMAEDTVASTHPERRLPLDEPTAPRGQLHRVPILLSKRTSWRSGWWLA